MNGRFWAIPPNPEPFPLVHSPHNQCPQMFCHFLKNILFEGASLKCCCNYLCTNSGNDKKQGSCPFWNNPNVSESKHNNAGCTSSMCHNGVIIQWCHNPSNRADSKHSLVEAKTQNNKNEHKQKFHTMNRINWVLRTHFIKWNTLARLPVCSKIMYKMINQWTLITTA